MSKYNRGGRRGRSNDCCGGRYKGPSHELIDAWLSALSQKHPDWPNIRLMDRAIIEAMKGKSP